MSSWNADVYQTFSPSECHWSLCRAFIDRYRHHLPEEQVVAQAHSFASSQLQMRDEADQKRWPVLDQIPVGTELIPVENSYCEREAEPEFPQLCPVVEVAEKRIKPEPEEVVEISDDDAPMEVALSNSEPSEIKFITELSELTIFKPVDRLLKKEEIYRNVVILDNNYDKTHQEFEKLGLGRLLVIDQTINVGHCRGIIAVKTSERQFTLVEAWSSTLKKVKQKVKKEFLREMKLFCYQIVSKKPFPYPDNCIARSKDLATNINFYRSIVEDFSKQPIKQDLTFSKEFSTVERGKLKKIAHKLNLKTCIVGPQKSLKLKILARSLPALVVVERIVVQKDSGLSELYDVIPPSLSVGGGL